MTTNTIKDAIQKNNVIFGEKWETTHDRIDCRSEDIRLLKNRIMDLEALSGLQQNALQSCQATIVSSDAIFAHIFFVHFRPNFTLHSLPHTLTFLLHAYPVYVSLFMPFMPFHTHEQTTRTRFDWYYQTPNNSTTGLLTFRNSPAVFPPHPDPAREPPLPPPNAPTTLPPPNAPTTQSSRLPGHGARVGVCPSCEYSW